MEDPPKWEWPPFCPARQPNMPASLAKRCITFCETVEYRNVISGNSLGNAARKDNDLDETARYAPMQKGMFLWLKPPSDVSPIDVGFDAPLWLGRLTNDEPPERSTPRPTDKFDVEFWGPFKNNCLSNDLLGTVRSRARTPPSAVPCLVAADIVPPSTVLSNMHRIPYRQDEGSRIQTLPPFSPPERRLHAQGVCAQGARRLHRPGRKGTGPGVHPSYKNPDQKESPSSAGGQ